MLWEGAILYCSQHSKHKNPPIPEKQLFDSSIAFSQYQVYSDSDTHALCPSSLLNIQHQVSRIKNQACGSPFLSKEIHASPGGIKYRGAVDNFADRIIVEFRNLPIDSWLIRWLKSYKLHLEGND